MITSTAVPGHIAFIMPASVDGSDLRLTSDAVTNLLDANALGIIISSKLMMSNTLSILIIS